MSITIGQDQFIENFQPIDMRKIVKFTAIYYQGGFNMVLVPFSYVLALFKANDGNNRHHFKDRPSYINKH